MGRQIITVGGSCQDTGSNCCQTVEIQTYRHLYPLLAYLVVTMSKNGFRMLYAKGLDMTENRLNLTHT